MKNMVNKFKKHVLPCMLPCLDSVSGLCGVLSVSVCGLRSQASFLQTFQLYSFLAGEHGQVT